MGRTAISEFVHVAIGATQRDVQRMVLRQAAGLGVSGALAGLAFAFAVRPLVARLAQDVSVDPSLILAAAALLVGVVLMAAWLPARRAARIEPTLSLRAQ